jgi:hypothetical protein
MYFSDQSLRTIQDEYQAVNAKYRNLLNHYITHITRDFVDAKAKEYATHGFPRRLKTLVRCIDNVFQPPNRDTIPTSDALTDATINIHAFVFNLFCGVENLAWIWVSEKNLRQDDGTPIGKTRVGLRRKNQLVGQSFSKEFREYLESMDAWFDYLENFRHALANRVLLYIPPYVITTDKVAAYQELERGKTEALMRHDLAEHDRLSAEQLSLAVFRPWMQHSYAEETRPVVFHVQLLTDFSTIEELGQKMLEEFDR